MGGIKIGVVRNEEGCGLVSVSCRESVNVWDTGSGKLGRYFLMRVMGLRDLRSGRDLSCVRLIATETFVLHCWSLLWVVGYYFLRIIRRVHEEYHSSHVIELKMFSNVSQSCSP